MNDWLRVLVRNYEDGLDEDIFWNYVHTLEYHIQQIAFSL